KKITHQLYVKEYGLIIEAITSIVYTERMSNNIECICMAGCHVLGSWKVTQLHTPTAQWVHFHL
ncbi:hypothetical protein ACQP3J_30930, partial [Escherichia coli]